jgi:hypothetical protein
MLLGTGIFIACIALGLQFVKRLLRVVCLLALLAGVGIAASIKGFLAGLTGADLWGIGIAGGATVIAAIVFVCQVHPKLGSPKRWLTPMIGLLLPSLLWIGIGGVAGKAIHNGLDKGGTAVDTALTTVIGKQGN